MVCAIVAGIETGSVGYIDGIRFANNRFIPLFSYIRLNSVNVVVVFVFFFGDRYVIGWH